MIKPCPIAQFAKSDPNAPAIITSSIIITYKDLNQQITQISNYLNTLPKYQPIQWKSGSSTEEIALLWACFRSNRIAFPINPKFPPSYIDSLKHQTNSLIVTPQDILTGSTTSTETSAQLNLGQTATYLLTSGTSGHPKVAFHTLKNYIINASGTLYNIPLIPSDRWLLNLPLYHVGGLGILMRCFLSRAAVVLPNPTMSISTLIDHAKISHISAIPTQLKILLDEERNHHPTLHAVLIGGAKCPQDLIQKAIDFQLPIHTTYGLTEMTSQVTTSEPQASIEELTTSGSLLCDRELKISSTNEIWVKGPCLFQGYLTSHPHPYEKTTYLALTEDGWFQTNDTGHIDSKGRLVITGRLDRLIISGGENIHPEEIESTLLAMDEIQSAIVKATFDPKWGQRPIAYISTKTPLSEALKKKIISHLNERLPKYKHPDQILPSEMINKTWKQ